jgi:branched-subunit amino acid transport protein AzlD
MSDRQYVLSVIVAMGLVTFVLRALPFVAARWLQKHAIVQRLGQFLPLAIMTLLLVHTMAGSAREHAQGPWPELLAVACVVVVQWRTRNALLSMLLGTGSYVWMRHWL